MAGSDVIGDVVPTHRETVVGFDRADIEHSWENLGASPVVVVPDFVADVRLA